MIDFVSAAKVLSDRVFNNPYIPHDPTPVQGSFLALPVREALFGGAAGGGKSDALLMAALMYVEEPGYNAILFRRTYSDLNLPEAIMARSHEWLSGTPAQWNGSDYRWTFPSGATLSFGYLAHDRDRYRYQSSAFQFIGFDELTQFPSEHYLYLFSRLRRLKGVEIPLRVFGATNPGGIGHDWVFERFVVDKNRPFIPAKLADNPYLDAEEYRRNLQELDDVTRRQLEDGEWMVDASGNPFQPDFWRGKNRYHFGDQQSDFAKPLARFQSWDTALTANSTSAYTAMVQGDLMPNYTIRISRVWRDKLIFPDLANEIEKQAKYSDYPAGWMKGIIIEGMASGKPAIQTLRRSADKKIAGMIQEFTPKGSKIERANQAAVWCKRGLVYLPNPHMKIDWLDSFEQELFNFPGGQYADQTDAFSQLIIYLENYLVTAWHGKDDRQIKTHLDSRVSKAMKQGGI